MPAPFLVGRAGKQKGRPKTSDHAPACVDQAIARRDRKWRSLRLAAILVASLMGGVGGADVSPDAARTPGAAAAGGDSPVVVDATTLDRKMLFGYQGWFLCPGDGSPV